MKNRSQHRREARAGTNRTDCLQPIASSDKIGARARGKHGYTSASLTRLRRGSDRSPLGSWGSLLESSGDASVRARRDKWESGSQSWGTGEPLYTSPPGWTGLLLHALAADAQRRWEAACHRVSARHDSSAGERRDDPANSSLSLTSPVPAAGSMETQRPPDETKICAGGRRPDREAFGANPAHVLVG